MATKKCPDCGVEKDVQRFHKQNHWYCKDCYNRRGREWRARKRIEYLAAHPKPIVTEKPCRICGIIKPLEQFNFVRKSKNQRSSYCKPCGLQRSYESRLRRGRDNEQLLYRCNRMGTTAEWHRETLARQNGVCAVCHQQETHLVQRGSSKIRNLAIDHNHQTGKARGLLCFRCNTSIHMIEKHGKEWARSAIAYLEQNE